MKTKTALIILAIAWLILGLFFALNAYIYQAKQINTPSPLPQQEARDSVETYTLAEAGLQFSYPGGDDGYTVVSLGAGEGDPAPLHTIRLLPTNDYLDEQGREGEGSPAWLLSVYGNEQQLQPAQWAEAFSVASNIEFALAQPEPTVVGGTAAVTYRIDGLYPAQVYVIAYGDFIYVAQAAFLDETARTYTEHQAWLDSFKFTPVAIAPSGKLNPQVACESALTYMTFENREAANAFVAACVAGEYPEVIERYKAGLEIEGATI